MSYHSQGMTDLRSDLRSTHRDQLLACVLELLEQAEVATSVPLLAVIMRHAGPQRPNTSDAYPQPQPVLFDLRITVANTLRQLASWGSEDREAAELTKLADQVEVDDLAMCCPMCQEVRCDTGCPLEPMRTLATTAPTPAWRCARCGSDRWAGWRAGRAVDGFPRKAQCVPCGHVQELPPDEPR